MYESNNIENKKQNRQKPPLSLPRIACEILAGTATGFAVALPVLYVTLCVTQYVITRALGDQDLGIEGFLVVGFLFLAFPALYGPATAVGVYLVGIIGNETASFLLTLAFAFLGWFIMIVASPLALLLSSVRTVGVEEIVAFWAPLLFIPPIFATIGFNLRRRHK